MDLFNRSLTGLKFDSDAVIFNRRQFLDDAFFEDLKTARENYKPRLDGMTHVAQIPVVFVEKWKAEGFDVMKAPVEDVLKKLRAEGMTDFIVCGNDRFKEA